MSAAARQWEPAPSPAAQWFAVWTRSQCETKVEAALRHLCPEVFLPRIRSMSRRRDRRLVLERPLFPGYVFPRFVPARDAYLRIANTDGVVRILVAPRQHGERARDGRHLLVENLVAEPLRVPDLALLAREPHFE